MKRSTHSSVANSTSSIIGPWPVRADHLRLEKTVDRFRQGLFVRIADASRRRVRRGANAAPAVEPRTDPRASASPRALPVPTLGPRSFQARHLGQRLEFLIAALSMATACDAAVLGFFPVRKRRANRRSIPNRRPASRCSAWTIIQPPLTPFIDVGRPG